MDAFTNVHLPANRGATIAAGCAALAILYSIGLAFYRLVMSPLAPFPGPTLAAVTGFYEFYYDVFKPGKYVFEIKKMHDQYGQFLRESSKNNPPPPPNALLPLLSCVLRGLGGHISGFLI